MLSLKPQPKKTTPSSTLRTRGRRRFSAWQLVGASVVLGILVLGGVAFALGGAISHAAWMDNDGGKHMHQNNIVSTIGGLNKISMVGSTENIIDANGKTVKVDANPYDVTAAPVSSGNLKAGDLIVNNWGAMGEGTTLVKFAGQKGTGHLFNISQTNIVDGPGQIAFSPMNDRLWVANSGKANDVVILTANGKNLATIKSPLFNHPWGMATNSGTWANMDYWSHDYYDAYMHHNVKIAFFTSNLNDGKILRIDVVPQNNGGPQFKVSQIGQLGVNANKAPTFIPLWWVPQLKAGGRMWQDVLLTGDPARNAITAFPNSTDSNYWNRHMGWRKGMVLFTGKPLNTPGGLALNPINGDLLVVNLADNNLLELNLTLHQVIATKQIDPMAVDAKGNGAALFGVLAVKDQWGNLKVFFTDDNTNSLNALSVS
ncbi:MAG TPA: hypothetical protein VKR06_22875 [Ktedonosporobacter sp.]|nr:hypothetical protein [Ktedonosporobacter sp.]